MLNVEWIEEATKDLRGIDEAVAKRILDKISWFSANLSQIVPEHSLAASKGLTRYESGISEWFTKGRRIKSSFSPLVTEKISTS